MSPPPKVMHTQPATTTTTTIFLTTLIAVMTILAVPVTCDSGTTVGLDAIIVGRCWDYKSTKYLGILPRPLAPCQELWKSFLAAVQYKPACQVAIDDYDQFFHDTQQLLPKDKVMFWSGLFAFSHQYSNRGNRYITLEDTLVGYLANSLQWCGQTISPGLNYQKCPDWTDCTEEATESFWGGASRMFASSAKGEVTLMLDGSNPHRPAYRRDSFFAKYELPNLKTDLVPVINVILVHDLNKPIVETCASGSLLNLAADVRQRGLALRCEDNPKSVVFLLCSDNPDSQHCSLAKRHMAGLLSRRWKSDKKQGFNQKPSSF